MSLYFPSNPYFNQIYSYPTVNGITHWKWNGVNWIVLDNIESCTLTLKNNSTNPDSSTILLKTYDSSGNITSVIYADGTISGKTYYGDGSHLTGISGGGTSTSGGTFTGPVIFLSGVTANTLSATTYFNLPLDIKVTGGTYSNGTATFTNNTGGTFTVTGFTTGTTITISGGTGITTGGTYPNFTITNSAPDQTVTLSGGTKISISGTYPNFSISTSGISDTYVTGGTYSNGVVTFTNNTGGTFTVTGLTTPFTGGTVTGATNFTNGLTANTISATTYFNLPSTSGLYLPLSGGTVTGATIVTDTIGANSGGLAGNALLINQTWNTTGSPTTFKVNVTRTSSPNNGPLLMDLQTNGSSQLSVTWNGNVTSPNTISANNFVVQGANNNGGTSINITPTFIYTTGNSYGMNLTSSVSPSSGNMIWAGYAFQPTINQTGSASGITRGFYVNPTLTSAYDFRAIEVVNGKTILGSSSGNVLIGTSTDAGYKLDINGTSRHSLLSTFNGGLLTSGNISSSAWGNGGVNLQINNATYTDTSTTGGTVTNNMVNVFGVPTLASTNTGITYTNTATVYIAGVPSAGTNATLTNSYALYSNGAGLFFNTLGGANAASIYITGSTYNQIRFGPSTMFGQIVTGGNGYLNSSVPLAVAVGGSSTVGFDIISGVWTSGVTFSGPGLVKLKMSPDSNAGSSSAFGLSFWTSAVLTPTEKMRIFGSGNVLIQNGGTLTDSGYRLDVSGTSRFQNTILNTGTYGTTTIDAGNTQGMIVFSGSGTVGGTGYTDFIKVTNTSAGATNPNKTIRLNNTGGIEFLNSVYTSTTLTLSDNGILYIGGGAASTSSNDGTKNYLAFNSNNSQIYDDSNLHIHSRLSGGAMWINTNGGQLNILNQSPLSGGAVGTGVVVGNNTSLRAYVNIYGSKTYTIGSYGYTAQGGTGTGGGTTAPYSLYCDNRVEATEFDATSDERLKDIQGNIDLTDAINLVKNIQPIKYTWKDSEDKGLKAGYSAQQVIKSGFKHLVSEIPNDNLVESTDEDGFTSPEGFQLTMNYDQVVPYHGTVIKYLLEKIELLEKELKEIKNK